MNYNKWKMSLAIFPFLLSLFGLIICIFFFVYLDNYLSIAFLPLGIIFFVLLCLGIRPILRLFNRIKIIKYVGYKMKPIEDFSTYLKENDYDDSCFMINGAYSESCNKAITALTELGLNGEELFDEFYENPFLVEDIVKSLKGLLADTAKPFGTIPYQFYKLVR